MLVQVRSDGQLRLFRQHAHALAAGELAFAWAGPERDGDPLSFELVLATALHDLSWRELDRRPLRDERTGRPVAFDEYPLAPKLEAYARGLNELEAIHRYAGLLGSRHYTSFPDVRAADSPDAKEFVAAERARRARLWRELDLEEATPTDGPWESVSEDEPAVSRDLDYLQLFDGLSIFVCLTPPSARAGDRPEWVERLRHLETPGGSLLHLTWMEDDVLHVDPFPFRGPVELRLRYRELPTDSFPDQDALDAAWDAAPDEDWWVSLRPAPRLA